MSIACRIAFCAPALLLLAGFQASIAQSVTLFPTSVSFGSQAVGTSSPVHKITLKNGQSSAITISSISANLADYSQTNNCPISPATLSAGSTCVISITFTPAAQGARNATVTVTDTGLSSPQTASLTGTGTAPTLKSISVMPNPASVTVALTQQLTATGTYSDGSTQDLTTSTSWSSSSNAIATVGIHTGWAKGVSAGTVTMTATSGAIKGTTTLTVTTATLTSITVSPTTASIPAGKTKQFTATGIYNNGTTQTITNSVTWTSSATGVATITAGLATGVATGTATITATSGTISGSAMLTVTAATLSSIAVTPATSSVNAGATQQFTATGTYTDGTTKNLTTSASWTSSSTSTATIGLHTGVATAVAVGTATITATAGTIKSTATLTVTPALRSISITPGNSSFALGTTLQFAATGTYSDGSTLDLTGTVTWTTANPGIASINAQGLASSVAVGSTTITATSGSVSGSTSVTVSTAALVSIAVTPAIPSIASGATQQFTATGTYTDQSTQNITTDVQWNSNTPGVATISNASGSQGLATSVAQGSATITATLGSVSGSTTLTVTPASLVTITVSPASPAIAAGTTQQFAATGTYSDGSTQDLTTTSAWASDTPGVATINGSGIATAVAKGTATITATSGSVTGSTVLTVTAATLVSIAINPATATIALGTTQQFTATGTYSDGSSQDLTQTGNWTSSVPTVATISDAAGSMGLATSSVVGTTTISLTSGNAVGTATLIVNPAALLSITISPQNPTIDLGASQQFTAIGTYTDGSTQDLTSVATWNSTAATVAVIGNGAGSYGFATSSGQGTTTISATSGSIVGSTSLTVSVSGLVSIAITPSNPTLSAGDIQQFTATGTYADNTSQNITNFVTWSSDNSAVVAISNSAGTIGLAAGVATGTAHITASSGTIVSPASAVSVIASGPTLTSISVAPASPSLLVGSTQQFTATGNYSDGSTQDLTTTATWSSSATTVATISNSGGMNGAATGIGSGTTTITAMVSSISGSTTLTVTGAAANLSPTSLTFATQSVGTTSAVQTVTLTNSGNSSLTISSISVTTNYAQTNNCGTSLVAGANCSVSVTFSPTTTGTLTGSLSITDNATGSPQSVTLTGTGTSTPASPTLTVLGPSQRVQHSAVLDPAMNTMIMFGGLNPGVSNFNDVWQLTVYEGVAVDWKPISPAGVAPSARYGHTGVYDSSNSRMIVFGGATGLSSPAPCQNDTWVLQNANGVNGTPTWVALNSSGSSPTPRYSHTSVYDPSTNTMIVFGGSDCASGLFNDVWLLSNANGLGGTPVWSQLSPSGSAPTGRSGASAIYDQTDNLMIVFGGNSGSSLNNDVWVLSNANGMGGTPTWTQQFPAGSTPGSRTGHSAVYDAGSGRMIVFGGQNSAGNTLSDTWILTGANTGSPSWIPLSTTGGDPKSYHSAVYNATNNEMIVWGGRLVFLPADDHTFVLSDANGLP